MPLGEFDLIERYFRRPQDALRGVVALGSGDDCALLLPEPAQHWAISTDTLVEGRHFLSTVDPDALGHKALAVNLSDLAAMGAQPRTCTLNLTLPAAHAPWLAAFARGFFALADRHDLVLCGGDTTGGPLSITVTVLGTVPPGAALKRSGARVGDRLWVSHPRNGGLGDARAALEQFRGTVELPPAAWQHARLRMERPEPRVALGLALRGIASAAIDLSDGLVGDLGHLLKASGCGATLDWTALPMADCLAPLPLHERRRWALAGGDDYELAFAAPADADGAVRAAAERLGLGAQPIGWCEAAPGLRIVDAAGQPLDTAEIPTGYDHFA